MQEQGAIQRFLEKHPDVDPVELDSLPIPSGPPGASGPVWWRLALVAVVALLLGSLVVTAVAIHVANVAVEVAPTVAADVVKERVQTVRDEWGAHADALRALASDGVDLALAIVQTRLGLDAAGEDARLIRTRFDSLRRDLGELDLMALMSTGGPRMIELVEATTRVLARLQRILADLEVFGSLKPALAGDLAEFDESAVPDRTAAALRDAVARLAAGTRLAQPWSDYASRVELEWAQLADWLAKTRDTVEDPSPLTGEILERLPEAVLDALF